MSTAQASPSLVVPRPDDSVLFGIYLEMGYDDFCAFGGIMREGEERAHREWLRREYTAGRWTPPSAEGAVPTNQGEAE